MNKELEHIRAKLIWNWKTLSKEERQLLLLQLYENLGTLSRVSAYLNHQLSRSVIDNYLRGHTQSHGGSRFQLGRSAEVGMRNLIKVIKRGLRSREVFTPLFPQ